MSITHKVWSFATARIEGKTINLSAAAKVLNVRVATLWAYHHGVARWTADLWLRGLFLMGAAKIENDAIVIPINDEIASKIDLSHVEPWRNKNSVTKLEKRKLE